MDDRVDVLGGEYLGDDGGADVGAEEADVTEVRTRRDHVDSDHGVHAGVGSEPAGETAADGTAHAGDEHDATHGRCRLLALAATLDARLLEQLAVLLLRHPLAALLDY
jgi:hypothetical protein